MEALPSYTTQVLSVAKTLSKTVSAIGESVVASISGGGRNSPSISSQSIVSHQIAGAPGPYGVVSIYDISIDDPKVFMATFCN